MSINHHEKEEAISQDSKSGNQKSFPDRICDMGLEASIARGMEQSKKGQTTPHHDVMMGIRKKYKIDKT